MTEGISIYEEFDALRTRLYSDGDTSVRPELERLVSRIQRAATAVVNREVLLCLSGPVEDWIANNPDALCDDCENYYTTPDSWTAEQCAEWLDDRGIEVDPTDYDGIDSDDYLEALQDIVRDNAEPAEVYEWWAVSGWLADYLRGNGHVMLDWFGIDVWGRECTGQAISMDTVIADFVQEKDLIANGWGD